MGNELQLVISASNKLTASEMRYGLVILKFEALLDSMMIEPISQQFNIPLWNASKNDFPKKPEPPISNNVFMGDLESLSEVELDFRQPLTPSSQGR